MSTNCFPTEIVLNLHSAELGLALNPTALRRTNPLLGFGCSECNRVNALERSVEFFKDKKDHA